MRGNGSQQVCGAAVVQEEPALSNAPQRRRAELVSACSALAYVVIQPVAHVMDFQIAEQVCRGIAQTGRDSRCRSRK